MNFTMLDETSTTGTLKELRRTRKEEWEPDEDIPSAKRVNVQARSGIITKGKDSMLRSMKKVSPNVTFGSSVLLHLILDTLLHSFEVTVDGRIWLGLRFVTLNFSSGSIILWQWPLSNFI